MSVLNNVNNVNNINKSNNIDNKIKNNITKNKRFLEVDLIKGVAVIFMVIFHFFYLAYFMDVKKYNIDSGVLRFLAKSAHTTFISSFSE